MDFKFHKYWNLFENKGFVIGKNENTLSIK